MFNITNFVLITTLLCSTNCAFTGFLQIPHTLPQKEGSNSPIDQDNLQFSWLNNFNNKGQESNLFNPQRFLNTNPNSVACVWNGFQKNCANQQNDLTTPKSPTNQEHGVNSFLNSQGWFNDFRKNLQDFQAKFGNNNQPEKVDAVEMTKVEIKTWTRDQIDEQKNKDINYSKGIIKITTSGSQFTILTSKTGESLPDSLSNSSWNCLGEINLDGKCEETINLEKKITVRIKYNNNNTKLTKFSNYIHT